MKEKIEYLKQKREGQKFKNQLSQLNNYVTKRNKVADRSYNGVLPLQISQNIKKKKKSRCPSPQEKFNIHTTATFLPIEKNNNEVSQINSLASKDSVHYKSYNDITPYDNMNGSELIQAISSNTRGSHNSRSSKARKREK